MQAEPNGKNSGEARLHPSPRSTKIPQPATQAPAGSYATLFQPTTRLPLLCLIVVWKFKLWFSDAFIPLKQVAVRPFLASKHQAPLWTCRLKSEHASTTAALWLLACLGLCNFWLEVLDDEMFGYFFKKKCNDQCFMVNSFWSVATLGWFFLEASFGSKYFYNFMHFIMIDLVNLFSSWVDR